MARPIHKRPLELGEKGFASIVIALVLIIVLALFTVGFAQLSRREQKNALDKQLSTQAYFAAESGINDADRDIKSGLITYDGAGGTVKANDTECMKPTNPSLRISSQDVNSTNGVAYSCVLINLKPPSVMWDPVEPETHRYIVTAATSDSGGAERVTVNWGSRADHTCFPANANDGFLPAASWSTPACQKPGVLQFSLTPLNDLSRAALSPTGNSFTVYLYPTSTGGASIAYNAGGGGNNGAIVSANCNISRGDYPCQATITGLTGGTGKYLFRAIAHYDASRITINGKDGLGQPVRFDGQVSIDVAGRAHEVLRRIRVHKALKSSFDYPKEALISQSTCKYFATDPLNTPDNSVPVALPQDSTGACLLNN